MNETPTYTAVVAANQRAQRSVATTLGLAAPAAPQPTVTPVAATSPPAHAPRRPTWHDLSPQEARILRLILQGARRSDVARQLGISGKTFDTHRGRALRKLGATTEVVALMMVLADHVAEVHRAGDGSLALVFDDVPNLRDAKAVTRAT